MLKFLTTDFNKSLTGTVGLSIANNLRKVSA